MLEYFSSTHGARKGLADTALKTADSGYLTRKLADVAQNVIVSAASTAARSTASPRATIYKGETVDVPLKELIVGRTARDTIRNPITDEMIVRENQIITPEIGRQDRRTSDLDAIRVRSPLTCESPLGVCCQVLRRGHDHGPAGRRRHGGGHHRRPVDRRARHAAHDANVPHRRCRERCR